MTAPPKKIRKSVLIDPVVLARARQLLGTTTDSETIEQALDLVAFKHEAIGGISAAAGQHLWTDVFGDAEPMRRPGHEILELAGSISPEDLRLMERAIEEGCERVDESEWVPPAF